MTQEMDTAFAVAQAKAKQTLKDLVNAELSQMEVTDINEGFGEKLNACQYGENANERWKHLAKEAQQLRCMYISKLSELFNNLHGLHG